MTGKVLSTIGGKYSVFCDGEQLCLSARGSLKQKNGAIKVGDDVEIVDGIIVSVNKRKSFFPRINVANIDCVNIVLCEQPEPDFLLVDKMIIETLGAGAKAYITVNKADIDKGLIDYVKKNYSNVCEKIFVVSALTGDGIESIKSEFANKFVAFAGQSAVGKTSIVNRLFGTEKATNTLSEKTLRGKHTTTNRVMHVFSDLAIIDTPGFSSVITSVVKSSELPHYYSDFEKHSDSCKYLDCTHVNEPCCGVKNAVEEGLISRDRYKRYLMIFKELIENEKRKY